MQNLSNNHLHSQTHHRIVSKLCDNKSNVSLRCVATRRAKEKVSPIRVSLNGIVLLLRLHPIEGLIGKHWLRRKEVQIWTGYLRSAFLFDLLIQLHCRGMLADDNGKSPERPARTNRRPKTLKDLCERVAIGKNTVWSANRANRWTKHHWTEFGLSKNEFQPPARILSEIVGFVGGVLAGEVTAATYMTHLLQIRIEFERLRR